MKLTISALFLSIVLLNTCAAEEPLIPAVVNAVLPQIRPGMSIQEVERLFFPFYPAVKGTKGDWSGKTGCIAYRLDDRYTICIDSILRDNQPVTSEDLSFNFSDQLKGQRGDFKLVTWPHQTGPNGLPLPTVRLNKADCAAFLKLIKPGMTRAEVESILKPYRPIPQGGGGQGGPQSTHYMFNRDWQLKIWFDLVPESDTSVRKPADRVATEPMTIFRTFFAGTEQEFEQARSSYGLR